MNKSLLNLKIKIKPIKTIRKADKSGFNGYGKYRSNSNLPYGYLNQWQKESGIYYIKNKITDFIYIGSSNNISSRISKHFSQLKKGNHPNFKLLEDFNKYGIQSFDFGVLELTTINLLDKEKDYQLKEDKDKLYNLQIRHNVRSIAQIESRKHIDKYNHQTDEYRYKMKKIKSNKVGQFDRITGKLLNVFEDSDTVCVKFHLAKSTVLGCCNGSKKSAGGYIWHYLDKDNNVIAEGKGRQRTIIKLNEDIV